MSFRLSKAIRTASILILLALLFSSGCSPKAYSISGTVTGAVGEGVAIYIGGTSIFVTTDAYGKYTIANLVGTKKIIPAKDGYEFTPPERTVTGPSTTVDFISSVEEELPYNVSGTITGAGISGVTINVLGKAISTTSDSTGHYSFTGFIGSNILVPSKSGYTYAPTQLVVSEASTNANFFGSAAGGGSDIATMCGGDGHTLAIKTDGSVIATGDNGSGQLGINSDEDSQAPVQVTGLSNVTDIACGQAHSAAITNGDLYTWGWNISAQLGDGGTTDLLVPTLVTAVPGVEWADVACGYDHTIALTDTHVVYTWGSSEYGQLGRSWSEETPFELPGVVNLDAFLPEVPVAVYAGCAQSYVLMSGGGMVSWGSNYFGELGRSSGNYTSIPGSVLVYNVEEASAGDFHVIVKNSSGELYVWGYGWMGAIGDGTTDDCPTPKHIPGFDNAIDFVAKGDSSFVVKSDGTVWAWGNNSSSYLGVNSTTSKITDPTQVVNVSDIASIYGGYDYTFAFENDGTMWGWGENNDGQLGDNTWTPRPLPVQLNW